MNTSGGDNYVQLAVFRVIHASVAHHRPLFEPVAPLISLF